MCWPTSEKLILVQANASRAGIRRTEIEKNFTSCPERLSLSLSNLTPPLL